MQTFLPDPDFHRCAALLDDKRLGKQRVETLQIMQVLVRLRWENTIGQIEPYEPRGWRNHPAVLMWKGYELALLSYQQHICEEWTARGYRDTCLAKTRGLVQHWRGDRASESAQPPWLGDVQLHRSHQSNLIRKDPDFYGPLFPGVSGDEPYVWPVSHPVVEPNGSRPAH